MILKFKKALILSSLACLLPIPVGMALWKLFPEGAITGTWIALIPLSMLAAQWVCVAASALDKSNQNKNEKIHKLILWVMPFLPCTTSGVMYALLLGLEFSPVAFTMIPMGLLFMGIGNYMPKTRMNATMGIKIKWTYSSEANWNATHRLAGKVWFFGGVAMILAALLPERIAIGAMLVCIAVMILVPMFYSYRFYKREKAEGKELLQSYPIMDPRAKKALFAFLTVLGVFLLLVMFTGEIQYHLEETSFSIEADWYSDLTVSYDSIDAIEYREDNFPSLRVGGFSSARLLMGFFESPDLGLYTRYTPADCESCIVITRGKNLLVLSADSPEETQALYHALLEKVN